MCRNHDSNASFLVPDAEIGELPRRWPGVAGGLADMAAEFGGDALDDAVHLGVGSFHDELDAAVGQVADVTRHPVPLGHVARRIAESDALDVAGEVVRAALHGAGGRLAV